VLGVGIHQHTRFFEIFWGKNGFVIVRRQGLHIYLSFYFFVFTLCGWFFGSGMSRNFLSLGGL